MEWSNDFTLQFLELYQGEPCLWNCSHQDHKRKEKLAEAWARLSEITGKPVAELKKKKDSLMATFRGHLRKKKASIKRGAEGDEVYKPIWFAYNIMEGFLCQKYNSQLTINTEDTVHVGNDSFDPIVEQSEGNDNTQPINSTPSLSSQQTLRRRRNHPELHEAENQMKEAFTLLKNVVSQMENEEEDECDLYGKLLAKKLRKLPELERECLMHNIDGVVLNAMRQSRPSFST